MIDKRVGLLAGLLVLALGSGVMAQSPSPTPMYAPEDMTFALPREVGDIALSVEARGYDEFAAGVGVDSLRDLLIPLGKEPKDMSVASAKSVDLNDLGQSRLGLIAIRVAGVEAETLVEPVFRTLFGLDAAEVPPEAIYGEWMDFDGRAVFVLAGELVEGHEGWGAFIPVGEVIFVATTSLDQPEVTIEEVLAELP